jgi:hypothetical protein
MSKLQGGGFETRPYIIQSRPYINVSVASMGDLCMGDTAGRPYGTSMTTIPPDS